MNPLISAISRYYRRTRPVTGKTRTRQQKTRRQQLFLEALEDRITPSYDLFTMTGAPTNYGLVANQPSGAIAVQLQDNTGHVINAASNLTVKLSSSSSAGEFLDPSGKPLANSSIVIPAGSSFALFEYEDGQMGNATVTAQASNPFAFGGFNVNIKPLLAFTTPTQTIVPGEASQPITVQLQDANGNAIKAASDTTVTLTTLSSTGKFLDTSGNPLTPNSSKQYSLTIAAGSSSASFEYEDSALGPVDLSASGSTGGESASLTVNLQYSLAFTTPVQVLGPDNPTGTFTIQLQDAKGNAVQAANAVTLNLKNNFLGGEFLDTSGNPLPSYSLGGYSLTVPAGASSASFEFKDGASVSFTTNTITAAQTYSQIEPFGSSQQQVYVGYLNITTPPQTFAPNKASQPITVQLDSAAKSDLTINLSSSSSTGEFLDTSGNALANNSITIAAGSSSAQFEYEDSQIGLISILANYANESAAQEDSVGVSLNFTTPPQTVGVNQTSQPITVQLQGPNGQPYTTTTEPPFDLSSSNGGEFLTTSGSPISSISIPDNSSSASFEYEPFSSGTDTVAVVGFGAVPLSATQQETVTPRPSSSTASAVFVSPAQTIAAGQASQPITVQLQNEGAAVTATSAVTLTLSSSSSTGQFLDSSGNPLVNNSITIAAGASSVSFEYEDSQEGLASLSASMSGSSGQPVSQIENIGGVTLAFTTAAQTITAGKPSADITLQLQDSQGKAVTAASDVAISLGDNTFSQNIDGQTGKFLDTKGNQILSLTIPAGSSSASFEYEDSVGGKPTLSASLSALQSQSSAPGSTNTATQQETVAGPYTVEFASSFSLLGQSITAGQVIAVNQPSQPITVQLFDSLNQPATVSSPVTIQLSSTSSTGKFLDTSGNPLTNNSITIPSGSGSASFEYEDSQAGLPTLTASDNGFTTKPVQENVGTSLVFTTSPQTLDAGQASQPVTVQLQDSHGDPIAAPSDMTLSLTGSGGVQFLDTSGKPIGYLTISKGSSSASFEFNGLSSGTPTLSLSYGFTGYSLTSQGLLSASQQETVQGQVVGSKVVFTTSPQTVTAGQTSQLVTLQLEDSTGKATPAPSGGLTFDIGLEEGSVGAFTGVNYFDANGNPLPASNGSLALTMPAGSSTVSFEFETGLAGSLILITEGATGVGGDSQQATVQAGPPSSVVFVTPSHLATAGTPSGSITVKLEDKYGNVIQAGSGGLTLNLSSSSSSGQFLSVSGDPLASPSITIPQGGSSATFEYEDSQSGTPTLTVTASGVSQTQQETVASTTAEIHVTNTNDSGNGSLRDAITAANNNPDSTIVFDSGVTGTIDLLSELPNITANTNILGPGANLLTVERSSSAAATFDGFAIGIPTTTVPPPEPSATISGLTVANFDGTGISNYGDLTLRQVDVNNTQPQPSTLGSLLSSLLTSASQDTGISNTGTLTVLDSTIADNNGAGISGYGSLTVLNSTITGNTNSGIDISSLNFLFEYAIEAGTAYIANSTISGNTVQQTTGSSGSSAGGITNSSGVVTLYDSIVAGNTGSPSNPADVQGSFTSLGYNLIGSANSQSSGFVSSDQVGTVANPIDPQLDSLKNNGGPTPTMALLTGSPAIAAGSSANAPATDQRGDPRPTQGAIDIGAAEVTTSNNSISLLPATLPSGTVGVSYNQSITASGGSGTLTLSTNPASLSLPAGLSYSINGSTLTISGKPTASGSASFSVTAADASGDTRTRSYTLTVNAATTSITLSPGSGALPSGTVGVSYNQSITASGGSGALTLSTNPTSLSLPAGLSYSISGSTLTIGGKPTASGSVSFSVTATDASGHTETQNYTLSVNAVSPPHPPHSPPPPPVLHTPPFLAFLNSFFGGGAVTVNADGSETVTDSFFGFPLIVSTFDSSGKLVDVTLFGFDITFLFLLL